MPLKSRANLAQDNQEVHPINLPKKLIEHNNIQFAQLNIIWVQAKQKELQSKCSQIEKKKEIYQ